METDMQIDIQTRGFSLSDALRQQVLRRIGYFLSSRYDQIDSIAVRLFDVNGPRGGDDKCCRIRISLPRHSDVIVEDTEADLYVAISRAADRATRTIGRRLSRRRHRSIRTTPQVISDGTGEVPA
jgi:ribosome-associated translation inhibitor RaiA